MLKLSVFQTGGMKTAYEGEIWSLFIVNFEDKIDLLISIMH